MGGGVSLVELFEQDLGDIVVDDIFPLTDVDDDELLERGEVVVASRDLHLRVLMESGVMFRKSRVERRQMVLQDELAQVVGQPEVVTRRVRRCILR